jgi:hypothetical protein
MFSIGATYWEPLIALAAGVLILLTPRTLPYILAVYLIMVGLIGLNVIR